MATLSKKKNKSTVSYNTKKSYALDEAVQIVKSNTSTKFDASMDIAIRLGIDPKKTDQSIRGTVSLPHGTGKHPKILVLCSADKVKEAEQAGANYVGLDDYLEKIQKGWTDVDVIVTMPTVMVKLGKLGKILGPRGLMPNPKEGNVTMDVGRVVQEIKSGKISFKNDKYGIIHGSIGRISFPTENIIVNITALLKTIVKLRPVSAKGVYIHSISLSSTMSKGVFINKQITTGL